MRKKYNKILLTRYVCDYRLDHSFEVGRMTYEAGQWPIKKDNVLYKSISGSYRAYMVADNVLDATRKFMELLSDELSKVKEETAEPAE